MYELSIKIGIDADPRGRKGVEKHLSELRDKYEKMSDLEKKMFDVERLTNPFSDTRLLYGDFDRDMKRVMVGIDIHGPEMIIAKQLADEGKLDGIINHHATLGCQLSCVYDALICQASMMGDAGVPYDEARKIIEKDIAKWEEQILGMGRNFSNDDLAKLLGLSIIGIHTPCDNLLYDYTKRLVAKEKPKKVKDLLALLLAEPENEAAAKMGVFPRLFCGDMDADLGDKIFYYLTGCFRPREEAFKLMADSGLTTFVTLVAVDYHLDICRQYGINLITFPHYPGDNLGINLLLDEFEKRSPLDVIEVSNFFRCKRI